MRVIYPFILIINICFNLFAFELSGDPKSWAKEDFSGFDKIGDCTSDLGDMSSVFTRVENEKLLGHHKGDCAKQY